MNNFEIIFDKYFKDCKQDVYDEVLHVHERFGLDIDSFNLDFLEVIAEYKKYNADDFLEFFHYIYIAQNMEVLYDEIFKFSLSDQFSKYSNIVLKQDRNLFQLCIIYQRYHYKLLNTKDYNKMKLFKNIMEYLFAYEWFDKHHQYEKLDAFLDELFNKEDLYDYCLLHGIDVNYMHVNETKALLENIYHSSDIEIK